MLGKFYVQLEPTNPTLLLFLVLLVCVIPPNVSSSRLQLQESGLSDKSALYDAVLSAVHTIVSSVTGVPRWVFEASASTEGEDGDEFEDIGDLGRVDEVRIQNEVVRVNELKTANKSRHNTVVGLVISSHCH